MNKIFLMIAITSMVLFSACGGEGAATDSSASEESAAPAAAPVSKVAEIELAGGDDMKFDQTELRVKAGQKVELTLIHVGKLPKEAMGHNFVLLQQGVDLNAFAASAMTAIETDYVPEGDGDKVIAYTKLLGGGESTSITFDAPAPGTYDFLCSFPGHNALMRGKFIVE